MKKPLVHFIICLLFSGTVVKAQNVNYRILSDDPRSMKKFSFSLEPLSMDLHMANLTIGYSIRADLLIKRFEFRGDFRKAYFDMNETSFESINPAAKNGIKKSSYYEAGASIFFTDKVKNRNLKIVLSSTRVGNYEYTRYIMVPGSKRKMWGVRGGLFNLSTAFEFDSDRSYVSYTNGNTTATPSAPQDGSNFNETMTMMNAPSFYAGLHWKSITNLWVETDYGTRGNTSVNDFFVDFLYAPAIILSDVRSAGGMLWNVDVPSANKRNIGWRAGWVIRRPEKTFMAMKVELGSRPGIRTKSGLGDNETVYMLMTFGINIPVKIKKLDN